VTAQNTLEKVLDLTLVWKKGAGANSDTTEGNVRWIESCLHLNLVFLFLQMDELSEAADHLAEVEALLPKLGKRQRATLKDYYHAIGGRLLYAQGQFGDAAQELRKAKNQDYPSCLHLRAKLHLAAREFTEAEHVLRKVLDLEGKTGSVVRPGLQDLTLDLAESLFGQGKYDEAFAALQEARAIVADFALPVGKKWRKALIRWSEHAKELSRTDALGSLAAELQQLSTTSEQGITISTRLRVRAVE
jgi:tetratricopeptide (TPR) repeat protein